MMLCAGLLSACQPQNDSNAAKSEETTKPAQVTQTLPLIEAKVRPLQLAHSIACDEEGCTQMDWPDSAVCRCLHFLGGLEP